MVTISAFLFAACDKDDITITDIDGNTYQAAKIGNQVWMTENLQTTRYADGSAITHIEENTAWAELEADEKVYCWYDNDISNVDTWGMLYTWAAAVNGNPGSDSNPSAIQGVCPDGWHLPSEAEWEELIDYAGGNGSAGNKLKESGTDHWNFNWGSTDDWGFSVIPGGYRSFGGSFVNIGELARFWSASETTTTSAVYFQMDSSDDVYSYNNSMSTGFSVRCVKD